MTPEQQREQWLKRILPALVVLVVYFVFISGFITEKSKKAQQQYTGLVQKGINAAALPGIAEQQQKISTDIAKLELEGTAIRGTFAAKSGFLSRSGSANDTIEEISIILKNNNLQVLDEKRNDSPDKEALTRSLRDTQLWLKDMLPAKPAADPKIALKKPAGSTGDKKKPEPDLNIWTIHYVGSYLDNYYALKALIDSDLKVLPVALTMQAYKPNGESHTGKQEWVLTLWL
jgi:hypothetical protein